MPDAQSHPNTSLRERVMARACSVTDEMAKDRGMSWVRQVKRDREEAAWVIQCYDAELDDEGVRRLAEWLTTWNPEDGEHDAILWDDDGNPIPMEWRAVAREAMKAIRGAA